jgi:hypothetical protein
MAQAKSAIYSALATTRLYPAFISNSTGTAIVRGSSIHISPPVSMTSRLSRARLSCLNGDSFDNSIPKRRRHPGFGTTKANIIQNCTTHHQCQTRHGFLSPPSSLFKPMVIRLTTSAVSPDRIDKSPRSHALSMTQKYPWIEERNLREDFSCCSSSANE